jgi:glycosyltransferase involved in cell wall biosynthesis
MNIAYYSHYFAPEIGAPSARIYDLARQWLSFGHRVEVVTCFPNHPVGKLYPGYASRPYMREQLDGIDVHRHWTYVTPNEGFVRKTLGHVSYLPSAFLLSTRRLQQPDVAVGTSPTFFAAMAAAAAGMRHRIPFIMEVRDLWPAVIVELGMLRNRHLIGVLERLEMSLYGRATRVVTVTESFRRDLIERGIPATKVFTIPNGADVEFWQPAEPPAKLRRRLGLEDRFVVLYIGAHGISHALSRLLESAERLQEQTQIQFVFVGEGAEKEQLVRRAREAGLKNAQFLDSVAKETVKEFYALADVCLVPLRDIPLFDTFIPSKMFEIMAMAKPIVGSLRGEAADILRRSGGGVVVEPEDSNAIAEAILRLYHQREQAVEMGRRGREFVIENYSRRQLAARYMKVMEEAVNEYRGARDR